MSSKIHRARITEANLDYEGSLTIDSDLMDACGLAEYEQIHVWNVARGTRLITYSMRGASGSGVICLNGAAAHLGAVGDLIIIAAFTQVPAEQADAWQPRIVLVDDENRIKECIGREIPGPDRRDACL